MITFPLTLTGGAQTGFTSPTYTTIVDQAPDVNSKQNAIVSLGGTQAGVTVHSGSDPFTMTVFKPKQYNVLGRVNPVTGQLTSIPYNNYKFVVRKGCTILAGQPKGIIYFKGEFQIPAGADIADPANIRACVSATIGMLNGISAGLGDTLVTNLLG